MLASKAYVGVGKKAYLRPLTRITTEHGKELIRYNVKCTDKKLKIRVGLEPGTFSATQSRNRRSI